VPAGKVSNQLVHLVDLFTTLVLAGGGQVPNDRQIDGMDMRRLLLGDAEESGRDAVLCLQGNRLQAVKWRQWKLHLFQQDQVASTFSPYNAPHLHNLEWDPRRARDRLPPWLGHPPDGRRHRRLPQKPGHRAADQAGHPRPLHPAPTRGAAGRGAPAGRPITQYVTALTRSHDQLPDLDHGVGHTAG
jgi:hypothetical protein